MEPARIWLPRVLAVAAFALFAASAPAGPHWLGAADAAAGTVGLGTPAAVPHPAQLALGGAATLIPLGELALRVHLMSAVFGALAVLWIGRLVIEIGRDEVSSWVGAAAAAGALAIAMPFFREATVAGGGALAAALSALALLLLYRVAQGEGAQKGLGLALVAGIGLATHVAFAALAPVIASLIWLRLRRGARWPLVAPVVLAGGGAAALAYLPLRAGAAATAPQPGTLAGMWAHLTAPLAAPAKEGASALAAAAEALGPVVIVAALGGALWLALVRRRRWLLAGLAALVAGEFFGAPSAGGVMVAVAAAALAGAGIASFARSLGRAGPYAGAAAAVIAVMPTFLAGVAPIRAAAPGQAPRALADDGLEVAPPRGIAIVRTAAAASSLRFAMTAESARPDLVLLSRVHGGGAAGFRELVVSPDDRPAIDEADSLAALIRDGAPRVAWELGPPRLPPGFDLRGDRAPFFRVVSAGEGGGDLEHAAEILAVRARASAGEPTGARVFADALAQLGALALSRGDPELARKLQAAALALDPENPDARAHLRALDP